ncbi:MAG: hypothetical protein IH991_10410 [Planctomycetes bacterium]|nr:hypothetical protein [Planctomycetota bacterium]
MKQAASETGGYFTQINPDEDIAWRGFELVSTLAAPRLLDVKVRDTNDKLAFLNFADSVVHGEEVAVVARFDENLELPESLTITGTLGGKLFRQIVEVEDVRKQAEYLPRSWAKLEIDRLIALGAEQNKDEIISLSKAMYVMSPFTSLLVLENEAMYEQFKVDRGRKDHWALYDCPETIEVVREPLPQGPRQDELKKKEQTPTKPSVDQILKGILVRMPRQFTPGDRKSLSGGRTYTAWWLARQPYGPDVILPKILQALNEDTSIEFVETPLEDVIDTISDLHRIPVVIDKVALKEIGIDPDTPITRNLKNVSLGSALPLLLKELDLTCAIQDDVLVITTNDGLSKNLTNAYSVGDLVFPLNRIYTWPDYGIHHWDDGIMARFDESYDAVDYQNMFLAMVPAGTRSNGIIPSFDRPALRNYWFRGPVRTTWHKSHILNLNTVTDLQVFPSNGQQSGAQVWEALRTKRLKYRSVDLAQSGQFNGAWNFIMARTGGGSVHFVPNAIDRYVYQRLATGFEQHRAPQGNQLLRRLFFDVNGNGTLPYLWDVDNDGDSVMDFNVDGYLDLYVTNPNWFWEMNAFFRKIRPGNVVVDGRIRLIDRDFPGRYDWITNLASNEPPVAPQLLYERPRVATTRDTFTDLLAYAPGMNTMWADVIDLLERESELGTRVKLGAVDEKARLLIGRARRRGWQRVSLAAAGGKDVAVDIDGSGRFRYRRLTSYGLIEDVICDGKALWHLYPEIGVGAKRQLGRHHRALANSIAPWMTPPVEDLSRGADVRLVSPNTVAIIPHVSEKLRDNKPNSLPVAMHLTYSNDGRLIARRWVNVDDGKILAKVIFGNDGVVQWFDGDGKQIGKREFQIADSDGVDLSPDTEQLVILPLPYRRIVPSEVSDKEALFAKLSDEEFLHLLADKVARRSSDVREMIEQRFFAKEDHRSGFYTLILACGHSLRRNHSDQATDDQRAVDDVLKHHPDSPLAHHFSRHVHGGAEIHDAIGDGFLRQLNDLENMQDDGVRETLRVWLRHTNSDPAEVPDEVARLLHFAETCDSPVFAWMALQPLLDASNSVAASRNLLPVIEVLAKRFPQNYAIRYELASRLSKIGKPKRATDVFLDLYEEALEQKRLPPISNRFVAALRSVDAERWTDLIEKACSSMIDSSETTPAVLLAWQCYQLGERDLSRQLLTKVLRHTPKKQKLATSVLATQFLWATKQYVRAEQIVKLLLDEDQFAKMPQLWNLGMQLARQQGKTALALARQQRLTELRFEMIDGTVDVNVVRQQYGDLLDGYKKLADAVSSLDAEPSVGFLARIVRAADSWRSLDVDPTIASQKAAEVLRTIGAEELAWDYLTTPLARKPNEASPWLDLAVNLLQQGEINLASRAYKAAFDAEATNAQILWDHSKMLRDNGRVEHGEHLLRQLDKGSWQPRFQRIQNAARKILAESN